jgi:hypothetical protein
MRDAFARIVGSLAGVIGLVTMLLLATARVPFGNGCTCWPSWWFCLVWDCPGQVVSFLLR